MDLKRLEIILMRHGTTPWNEEKRYLGHTDIGLSDQGREELAPVREKLCDRSFGRVYCSDLARCRESLQEVRPDLAGEAVYDDRLREMDFGVWEGHTYDQLKDNALYRQWLDEPKRVTSPQGESWEAFESRIAAFAAFMLQEAESRAAGCTENTENTENIENTENTGSSGNKACASVLLVAHGGVIRQIVHAFMKTIAFWDIRIEPGNLLVLTLERTEEGWSGANLGDI
ncbi:histidine phosphatase family protein [Paenibacillus sp. VCA1]|uniref:histidine phosphatase family protein n=1 Tax=Paenibacillus sp. VCA1 TaxID=3039148 RepID=UPI0028710E04|nr:histidine phosphatase family protein [Paenibacillus sp. VCA1]MDR9856165.1 histidine phosphatase family protein [Paenibacillus sp. VCA1]